ncbi:hypothetical protein [Streptomyces sp. NPDC101776]|uniref:hypothetical protein n=1 Tax=Streptomyces sp. NPDC101776 TaxID=3366146 RepID=UPI00380F03C9
MIDWLAPSFGMDGGHLVPGSSVPDLTVLWAARDLAGVRTVVSLGDDTPVDPQGCQDPRSRTALGLNR